MKAGPIIGPRSAERPNRTTKLVGLHLLFARAWPPLGANDGTVNSWVTT